LKLIPELFGFDFEIISSRLALPCPMWFNLVRCSPMWFDVVRCGN